MKTVADLLSRDRRSERVAAVGATGRTYDYHWLCTSAWKAGNYLRHTGVRRGVTVGVVGDGPFALLALFGTTLLEGTVWVDPPTDLEDENVRTVVAPTDEVTAFDLEPGAQRVGYGSQPAAPGIHHFERGLWSENPSFPPTSFDPSANLLTDGDRTLTHDDALGAARRIIDEWDLPGEPAVGVSSPLSDPRTVVAGIVVPLVAGGRFVLEPAVADEPLDVVVTDGTVDSTDVRSIPLAAVSGF